MLSRIAQMREERGDENYDPPMPLVDAKYLLDYLWEVGPTMAAGMGSGPITHQELQAWQALTGIELKPWENKFLRMLSIEFLVQTSKSEKYDAPAPWAVISGDDRDFVADKIRNLMSSRVAPKRKKGN